MRKTKTTYQSGKPDIETEVEAFFELTIVAVVSGHVVERFIRADSVDELKPSTVTVEGVNYIRYLGETKKQYVEFLKNAIVFRSVQYREIVLEDRAPTQRELERAEADDNEAEETVR